MVTTRLRTELDAEDWMKRVVSPLSMENLSQLMMVPLLLVMLSTLPSRLKVAAPFVTTGLMGLAQAGAVA